MVLHHQTDGRDLPGLPSRATRRPWAIGLAVSVLLHLAVVASFFVGDMREGDVTIARRPAEGLAMATQVTLFADDGAGSPSPPELPTTAPQVAAAQTDYAAPPAPSGSAAAAITAPAAAATSATLAAGSSAAFSAANAPGDAAMLGSDYRRRLQEHIAASRKSPPPGTLPGTVLVRFSVARGGNVVAVAVAVSSGNPVLDRTALDSIRNADPMPAIPVGFPDQLSVVLPVDFARTGQAWGSASR